MALSPEQEELASALALLFQATAQGVSPDRLREAMQEAGVTDSEAAIWIELAEIMRDGEDVRPSVTNPRYRKGTAMQPAKWADCLWRPTP